MSSVPSPKEFPLIEAFLRQTRKSLFVFDLETNGFRGSKHFAILELAYWSFSLDEDRELQIKSASQLFSTHQPLDAKVVELTGITPAMLRDKPSFEMMVPLFKRLMATPDVLISGYNSQTFDLPALTDELFQFMSFDSVGPSWDVRQLFCKLNGVSKGTLAQASEQYGVDTRGMDLHRADADVYLTALLLEAMLETHGIQACLEALPLPTTNFKSKKPVKSFKELDCVILEALASGHTVPQISAKLGVAAQALSRRLCAMVDEGLIADIGNAINPHQVSVFVEVLQHIEPLGTGCRLKDYMHFCQKQGLPSDYLVLQRALDTLGYPVFKQ